jgi:hypothetical protein
MFILVPDYNELLVVLLYCNIKQTVTLYSSTNAYECLCFILQETRDTTTILDEA